MIRKQLGWAAVLLAAGGLTAQDGEIAKDAADYGALSAEFDAAQKAYSGARREVMASEEYVAARRANDREKAMELIRSVQFDLPVWVVRFQAGAAAHEGTEAAVPFLTWICKRSGDQAATRAAATTLIGAHVESPELLGLVESPSWALRGIPAEEGLGMLERIAVGSPHAAVKAHALYYLATYTRRASPDDAEAAAKADAWTAQAEKLAAGTELELRIQGPRFQAEHLQIGMEVPDIEAEDLDGVTFKLSDYRGKVVVIDFWGDW